MKFFKNLYHKSAQLMLVALGLFLLADSQSIPELALAQSRRDTAQKGAELARTAFINGTGSSFDMIDTERRAREAEIDLAIKEFEVGRAQILSYLAQANCEI